MILIVAMAILGTLIGGGLWAIIRTVDPKYTSVGLIECKMPVPDDPLNNTYMIPRAEIITLETQTKALYFSNESFLTSVLGRDAVRNTKWFRSFGDDIAERLDELKASLRASPQRDSGYVRVSMTASSPKEAQLILNEAMTKFQQDMRDAADRNILVDLDALRQEKINLIRTIESKRSQVRILSDALKVPGLERGASPTLAEIQQLTLERLRLDNQRIELENLIAQIRQDVASGEVSSAVQFEINNDPLVRNYQQRIALYDEQRQSLLERFGAEHNQVESINSLIAVNQQTLAQRQSDLRQMLSRAELENLERQRQETLQMLAAIETRIQDASKRHTDEEKKFNDIQSLKEEIDDLNGQLERFDESIYSRSILKQGSGFVTTTPFFGEVPLTISFPKWQVFFPGGLVLGLMLGLGLAFLLEFMDDTVKSPTEVMRHLHVPLLGTIPAYEDEADTDFLARLIVNQPHELLSESFRQAKMNLLFSAPGSEMHSILLTGSSADAGTTVAAVNLACSLAAEEKKVLVVDANFHRPALQNVFPKDEQRQGLSYYLVDQASASEIIYKTDVKGVDVVYSGPKPPNPADLLKGRRMAAFLEQQKGQYDYVLLDGPPGLVVSDARLLAAQVDGTVVVVHAGETPRGVVQRMLREFQSPKIRILGLILNAVQPRTGGYFRKAFDTYYDYITPAADGKPADTKEKKKKPHPDGEIIR